MDNLVQLAVNLGIPLDTVPTSAGEAVVLQQSLLWATFILGLFFKGFGKLMGSMMGSVR